jgi:hypothetical protein
LTYEPRWEAQRHEFFAQTDTTIAATIAGSQELLLELGMSPQKEKESTLSLEQAGNYRLAPPLAITTFKLVFAHIIRPRSQMQTSLHTNMQI